MSLADQQVHPIPRSYAPPTYGITLQQEYVGRALAGILANPACRPTDDEHFRNIGQDAVRAARAAIAELEKKPQP